MIDRSESRLLDENLLTVTEAAAKFPSRPTVRTVWRWLSKGCRGVQLESVAVGCRRYTSHEAIVRFIEGTTARANGRVAGKQKPDGNERRRKKQKAARQLQEAGI